MTFNEGGTLSEYNAGPALSLRLCAVPVTEFGGSYERTNTRSSLYSTAMTRAAFSSERQKIRAALQLGASGNVFTNNAAISASRNVYTTNAAVEIFDASDNLIGRGCATSVGTRIE
ncbi:MAG: hypothetical protein WKF71_08695 [Pyrinomonadaceae bacterium]